MMGAAAALAVFAVAQPAMAADFLPGTNITGTPSAFFNVSGDPMAGGDVSASFGRDGLAAGQFTDRFLFTLGEAGLGSGSVTTNFAGLVSNSNNLDFLDILFSNDGGASFSSVPINVFGNNETGFLTNVDITAGVQNILSIEYLSRGNGSFAGQLAFTPTAAVPEPSTWALMLLGFGAIGFSMRRRRKDVVRVRYAF